jgi:hypothetical protein
MAEIFLPFPQRMGPETLLEQSCDMGKNLRLFEQANARHV